MTYAFSYSTMIGQVVGVPILRKGKKGTDYVILRVGLTDPKSGVPPHLRLYRNLFIFNRLTGALRILRPGMWIFAMGREEIEVQRGMNGKYQTTRILVNEWQVIDGPAYRPTDPRAWPDLVEQPNDRREARSVGVGGRPDAVGRDRQDGEDGREDAEPGIADHGGPRADPDEGASGLPGDHGGDGGGVQPSDRDGEPAVSDEGATAASEAALEEEAEGLGQEAGEDP